jgi:hypothetical protein
MCLLKRILKSCKHIHSPCWTKWVPSHPLTSSYTSDFDYFILEWNRSLFCRWLLITELRTTEKSVGRRSRFRQNQLSPWICSSPTVAFMKISSCALLHMVTNSVKYRILIKLLRSFGNDIYFLFWGSFWKIPLFWETNVSISAMHRLMLDIFLILNKFRPTVQGLVWRTSTDTHRHTRIQNQFLHNQRLGNSRHVNPT